MTAARLVGSATVAAYADRALPMRVCPIQLAIFAEAIPVRVALAGWFEAQKRGLSFIGKSVRYAALYRAVSSVGRAVGF